MRNTKMPLLIGLALLLAIGCAPSMSGSSSVTTDEIEAGVVERADADPAGWSSAWILNTTGETSPIFTDVPVNVTAVQVTEIDGELYQCITASGIPNYETLVTQELIDSLNNRPRVTSEFDSGGTTLSLDTVVEFGGDVGYTPPMGCNEGSEGYGYWPPGPACPTDQDKTQCFPLNPKPNGDLCETNINDMGTWVNGVAIFNWADAQSYEGDGVWQNEAFHFEFYDLDICPGHSANGNYHHHSNPVCLGDQLGDSGDGHSMIYGFAADGYPICGPWQAEGVLAQSCWKTRDYDDPTSPTGCGVAGERSCLLVDPYDISQGTIPADSNGPSTSDIVTSMSSNEFLVTSGYYFQDYYYDAACSEQGVEYMDEHNGHEHDDLGYHYHITLEELADGRLADAFPYYAGPSYAGVLPENSFASCSTGEFGGPGR